MTAMERSHSLGWDLNGLDKVKQFVLPKILPQEIKLHSTKRQIMTLVCMARNVLDA
jgi:hypothetical protein